MKASKSLVESLSDIDAVRDTGTVRRIAGEMLLALARKEVSATDIEAAARLVAAQAAHMGAEVKVARAQIELREKGADLGKVAQMGKALIGSGE